MNRVWLMAGVALLLGACATEENYRKILDRWVGSSEQGLVSAWGVPTGFYENGGTRYLTYRKQRQVMLEGRPPSSTTTMIGNYAHTVTDPGSSPMLLNFACETTFLVNDTRISSYTIKGNDCTAREPK